MYEVSLTKIIPKCSHMDPPIIDLQLCLMGTLLIAYYYIIVLVCTDSTLNL